MLNLGVTNGLNRELPFVLGSNYQRIAKRIAECALFVTLFASLVTFLSITITSSLLANESLKLSFWVLAIVSAIAFMNMYYSTTFRTNQAFLILSKINLALTLLAAISLILPSKYGYGGFLARIVAIEVIKLVLFLIFQPFPVRPHFSRFGFFLLIKTGIPLFVGTIFRQ